MGMDPGGRQSPCSPHLPTHVTKGEQEMLCFEAEHGRGARQSRTLEERMSLTLTGVWGPGFPWAPGATLPAGPLLHSWQPSPGLFDIKP